MEPFCNHLLANPFLRVSKKTFLQFHTTNFQIGRNQNRIYFSHEIFIAILFLCVVKTTQANVQTIFDDVDIVSLFNYNPVIYYKTNLK